MHCTVPCTLLSETRQWTIQGITTLGQVQESHLPCLLHLVCDLLCWDEDGRGAAAYGSLETLVHTLSQVTGALGIATGGKLQV